MAIAKIIAANQVKNFTAVVNTGGTVLQSYDRPEAVTLPSGDQLINIQNANGRFLGGAWRNTDGGYIQKTTDHHAPSSGNVGAFVYYPAEPYRRHVLEGLDWSYDLAPATGLLQVQCPSGTVIWGPHAVTEAGPGFFTFPEGLRPSGAGLDLIVQLSAGGPSSHAALTVLGHHLE